MFFRTGGFCGKTRFAQDVEEESSWRMLETFGHAANAA